MPLARRLLIRQFRPRALEFKLVRKAVLSPAQTAILIRTLISLAHFQKGGNVESIISEGSITSITTPEPRRGIDRQTTRLPILPIKPPAPVMHERGITCEVSRMTCSILVVVAAQTLPIPLQRMQQEVSCHSRITFCLVLLKQ
jgi:hypothetical protein